MNTSIREGHVQHDHKPWVNGEPGPHPRALLARTIPASGVDPSPVKAFSGMGWASYDDVMAVRTIIDLPEAERELLDAQCRQQGLSRAEAMRRALRLWLDQQAPQSTSVFGLWRDRPDDALQLQQALREEWER